MKSKFTFHYFYIILLCSYFFACKSANKKEIVNAAPKTITYTFSQTLQAGNLYENVIINDDALNSFSIYLPKLYHAHTLWPVIFFFDPNAKGTIPVKKYHNLADSLGFILVGSNSSKNGLQSEEVRKIWHSLKNSCLNQLSIDKNRITLAGFSGGARICYALAAIETNTHCLIANSAGAKQLDQILNEHTLFIGLSGKSDMNRAEMLNTEQNLQGSNLPHFYIEFEGIHEWAPYQTMQKAMMLSCLASYQKMPALTNSFIINQFIFSQKNEIEKNKIEGNWVDAYNNLVILNKGTLGLQSFTFENLDSLKNHPNYIDQKGELLKLNAIEIEKQQEIYAAINGNIDLKKWKESIELLKKNKNKKSAIGQMNQRLLGYASLVCYSLSQRSLLAMNYTKTAYVVDCYEIADPNNAEVYYLKAILFGVKGDTIKTLQHLKQAEELGFTDKVRLLKQVEFQFLRNDEDFKKMIN